MTNKRAIHRRFRPTYVFQGPEKETNPLTERPADAEQRYWAFPDNWRDFNTN